MTSAKHTRAHATQARMDVYALTIGANSQDKPFEVVAVYLHELPSYLPVPVIKTILKAEFEPEALRLLLSRPFAADAAALNAQFLWRLQEAFLRPLRSETYGAPPRHVLWHFFALSNADSLVDMLRKWEMTAPSDGPASVQSETGG